MERHKDLIAFAKKCIEANEHKDDMHPFSFYNCEVCETSTPFELMVRQDYDKQSLPLENLVGHIQGKCKSCGKTTLLLSTTEEVKTEKILKPVCECGNSHFIVGMCERIQGENGIPGLFEKRVVVAKCSECEEIQTVAYTE